MGKKTTVVAKEACSHIYEYTNGGFMCKLCKHFKGWEDLGKDEPLDRKSFEQWLEEYKAQLTIDITEEEHKTYRLYLSAYAMFTGCWEICIQPQPDNTKQLYAVAQASQDSKTRHGPRSIMAIRRFVELLRKATSAEPDTYSVISDVQIDLDYKKEVTTDDL